MEKIDRTIDYKRYFNQAKAWAKKSLKRMRRGDSVDYTLRLREVL